MLTYCLKALVMMLGLLKMVKMRKTMNNRFFVSTSLFTFYVELYSLTRIMVNGSVLVFLGWILNYDP